ncbi:MAG: ATP-binding protein [Ferrimicrobium sp.]|uniref:ATP-binding protein n=1 Tax=Ferrimicrobium acidiphilum TaxID=121039 RepID=A0ABV3XZC6_9ACTN
MISINTRCTGCGACISTCPTHALRPHVGRPNWLAERCNDHRDCVEICPAGAIIYLASCDSASSMQRTKSGDQ